LANYEIIEEFGVKEKVKGRAKSGIIVGIAKSINLKWSIVSKSSYNISIKFSMNGKSIIVMFCYVPPNEDIYFKDLCSLIKKHKNNEIIIMGDTNARISNSKIGVNFRESKDGEFNTQLKYQSIFTISVSVRFYVYFSSQ
jgi:hypothetical protein